MGEYSIELGFLEDDDSDSNGEIDEKEVFEHPVNLFIS